MSFDCLKNIVGISKEICPCLTEGLDQPTIDKLSESASDLYTDELEGGIHLKSLNGIDGCKSFAKLALEQRDIAIKRTEDEFVILLNQKYKKNKKVFKGNVFSQGYTKNLPLTKRWNGARIRPNELSDGVILINKIKLALNITAAVNVVVVEAFVDDTTGAKIAEFTVTSEANGVGTFALETPLRLPLRKDGQALEYYFLYDSTSHAGIEAKNNKVSCGCGGMERTLLSYVNVSGVGLDLINDLTTNRSLDAYAHGIMVDAEIRCDSQGFVCRQYDEEVDISKVLAYCVWYKTGELIIEAVLKSPEINRYTMMNREYYWGKRNHFRKEFDDRMAWLSSNEDAINIDDTDCFVCKDESGMFYSGIMK